MKYKWQLLLFLLMSEHFESQFNGEEEEQLHKNYRSQQEIDLGQQKTEAHEKERYIDPPLELPKRAYSLEPDMANGWKPKRANKLTVNNVFSINYEQLVVDEIVKQLYKSRTKRKECLVYLGPRRNNSYVLHQNRGYDNPYPAQKRLQQLFSARSGLPLVPKIEQTFLKFDADFEGGNLDAAVQCDSAEFDLFMRVDSNTRGHTNWYNFTVENNQFVGKIKFNICNFRRQKSLYQRGLKPYTFSKAHDSEWKQQGKEVTYQKQKLRYEFLYDDDQDLFYIEDQTHI